MTTLPKNWVVKNDRSIKYKTHVLGYINKNYNRTHDGYYSWYGICDNIPVAFDDINKSGLDLVKTQVVSIKDFVEAVYGRKTLTPLHTKNDIPTPPTPARPIIGYKVRAGVDRDAAASAIKANDFPKHMEYDFEYGSRLHDNASKFGVLNLLFEPVYEPDETNYQLPHVSARGTEFINVKINKAAKDVRFSRKAAHGLLEDEEFVFTKKELIRLLEYEFKAGNGVPFKPTMFRIGCENNYTIAAFELQMLVDKI